MVRSFTATAIVEASPAAVFAVLRDPGTHRHFDGSGMVGEPVGAEELSQVGQVFTMNMTYTDGAVVERYRSDNHVTVLEADRTVEWATAVHGGALLGWTWRYDLAPVDHGTAVRLIYDWTSTPAENVRKFGVPIVGPEQLAESLRRLVHVCSPTR